MQKDKGGRPRVDLDEIKADGWDILEANAVWATAEYCADKLGISADTLDRRLKEKYGFGFAEYKKKVKEPMRINLRKKQYDVAMQGSHAMLIWLGKNELGQSDKNEVEQTNRNIEVKIDKQDEAL